MATDIENSSCSSSLVDSGFESSTVPKPPPRKKRSKSTLNLAENDQVQEKMFEKNASTKRFSQFLKTFGPSAKEKLKLSWWSLVIYSLVADYVVKFFNRP